MQHLYNLQGKTSQHNKPKKKKIIINRKHHTQNIYMYKP